MESEITKPDTTLLSQPSLGIQSPETQSGFSSEVQKEPDELTQENGDNKEDRDQTLKENVQTKLKLTIKNNEQKEGIVFKDINEEHQSCEMKNSQSNPIQPKFNEITCSQPSQVRDMGRKAPEDDEKLTVKKTQITQSHQQSNKNNPEFSKEADIIEKGEKKSDVHLTTTAVAGPQTELVFYRVADEKDQRQQEQQFGQDEEDEDEMLDSEQQDQQDDQEQFQEDQYPEDYDDFVESILKDKLNQNGKEDDSSQLQQHCLSLKHDLSDYPLQLRIAKQRVLQQEMKMRCYQMENMGRPPPLDLLLKKENLTRQLLKYVNQNYVNYLLSNGGKNEPANDQNTPSQQKPAEMKKRVSFNSVINAKSFKIEDQVTVMNQKEVLTEHVNQRQKPPGQSYIIKSNMMRLQMMSKEKQQKDKREKQQQTKLKNQLVAQSKINGVRKQFNHKQQSSEDDSESVDDDDSYSSSEEEKIQSSQAINKSISDMITQYRNQKMMASKERGNNLNQTPLRSPQQAFIRRIQQRPYSTPNPSSHSQVYKYPTQITSQLPPETYYRLTFKKHQQNLHTKGSKYLEQTPASPKKETQDISCQTILTYANQWD